MQAKEMLVTNVEIAAKQSHSALQGFFGINVDSGDLHFELY
jgi:hypothetical protein